MKALVRNSALALLAALVLPATVVAQVAQPPDGDPFYAVPPGIAGLANGTVIKSRKVTVTALSVPLPADAWQVQFKTQDNTGAASAYVTTVMVPQAAWTGKGRRPLLSYQTPEDGVGLKCAPSYMLTGGVAALGNTSGDAFTIASALESGWVVVAPDYEGPRSMFLGAAGQARGVLDGLRAARAFAPAGIDRAAPIGLWGYSGGAIASSTAAQMQPSYAPDLKLAGVALGGNNASIRAALAVFDGSFAGGAIVIGVIGLDRAYPEFDLAHYLNDIGRAKAAQSQQDCIVDAAVKHPALRAADILTDPSILDGPVGTKLFAEASPLTFPGTPAAPIYDYHATSDELAPIDPDRRLVERYCAAGTAVAHVEDVGDHFSEVATGAPGAMAYLTDRFAGLAAPNTCRSAPRPSPPVPACSARRPGPRARLLARGVRLTTRLISLRGTATTTCDPRLPLATPRVTKVSVAIARLVHGRCRFVDARGRTGRARSCTRPLALQASGATRWRFTRAVRLPHGTYAVYAWAADSAARRQAHTRASRRVRV
jgi:hypothetical protein